MAEGIVVGLEEVGVDEQQREGLAIAQAAAPLGGEALVEAAAIGEAGEGIGDGERPRRRDMPRRSCCSASLRSVISRKNQTRPR